MDLFESLSLFQALSGAVLILASVALSLQTRKYIPEDLRAEWRKTTFMIFFFFLGYILFVLIRVGNLEYPLEPVTTSMFLGSACFVYFIILLIKAFISKLHEKDMDILKYVDELKDKNDELEREVNIRRRTEERLRSFEKAVETMQLGVTITDTSGRILYANPAEAAMHGLDRDELIGKEARQFAPSDLWNPLTVEQLKRMNSYRRESVNLRSDGSTMYVQLMSDLVTNPDGDPIAVVTVCEDISERRDAEAALRHRLMVEKAIAHVSSVLVSKETVDLTEVLAILGQAVEVKSASIFRFRDEGSVADNTSEWCAPGAIPAKDHLQGLEAAAFPWWMGHLLRNENIVVEDASRLPKEAERERGIMEALDMRSLLAVPTFSAGVLLGFVVFDSSQRTRGWSEEDLRLLRSASEILGAHFLRKKTEEESLKVRKLESLGILAGGIAHDFNNLLTVVLGNISIAFSSTSIGEDVLECLRAAEKAALRAKGLTHQLLTFSKGGAPVKNTASISDLVRESASFTQSGSNVKCEYHFPDDLWPVDVDEGQISQVVNNLLINADQAMPDGGTVELRAENIYIGSEYASMLKGGRYVKLTVKDHGVGILRENIGRIFDPYFTTKQEGNGLGLATAFSIVKKHDGHITVESMPGYGSSFHIYLPAALSREQCETCESGTHATFKGKILVLDDDEMVRQTAGVMLKLLGHEAAMASTIEEAVKLYKSAMDKGCRFDAVIMDLTIPGGGGGKDAVMRLIELDPQVRALVSSGYSDDPVMSDYSKYGFAGVLLKPYQIDDLAKALDLTTSAPG